MQNDFIDDLRNKEEKRENYFVFMKKKNRITLIQFRFHFIQIH